MSILDTMRKERHERWLRDWSEGLASCYHCDEDYINAQVIVIDDEKSCPHCKNPERKTYYYCEEHGSKDDDCKSKS
jgi:hypothetical protein